MAQTFITNLTDDKGYQPYKNELRSNIQGKLYTHKYNDAVLHKYPMANQTCRTKILDWDYHNIKRM